VDPESGVGGFLSGWSSRKFLLTIRTFLNHAHFSLYARPLPSPATVGYNTMTGSTGGKLCWNKDSLSSITKQ